MYWSMRRAVVKDYVTLVVESDLLKVHCYALPCDRSIAAAVWTLPLAKWWNCLFSPPLVIIPPVKAVDLGRERGEVLAVSTKLVCCFHTCFLCVNIRCVTVNSDAQLLCDDVMAPAAVGCSLGGPQSRMLSHAWWVGDCWQPVEPAFFGVGDSKH